MDESSRGDRHADSFTTKKSIYRTIFFVGYVSPGHSYDSPWSDGFEHAAFSASGALQFGGFDLSVAVADVNDDGKPDLVVSDYNTGVDVLLGNGDGTFQPAVTYNAAGFSAWSVAVADVNGDGKPDIAVATLFSNNVAVLLGNGDGTFQPAVTYPSSGAGGGACPNSVAIADVNGDAKPDLVVANWCSDGYLSKQLAVLLGNGDGTFQPAVAYGSGGRIPVSVAVADMNADGKPDLLVANFWASFQNPNGTVGVLLGNGDGTFQSPVAYARPVEQVARTPAGQ